MKEASRGRQGRTLRPGKQRRDCERWHPRDISNHESERVLRVNLLGPIEMARSVSQVLCGRPRRPNHQREFRQRLAWLSGSAAYSASKAGLDGLTRALARELGPDRSR